MNRKTSIKVYLGEVYEEMMHLKCRICGQDHFKTIENHEGHLEHTCSCGTEHRVDEEVVRLHRRGLKGMKCLCGVAY